MYHISISEVEESVVLPAEMMSEAHCSSNNQRQVLRVHNGIHKTFNNPSFKPKSSEKAPSNVCSPFSYGIISVS